jgi:uncharacterized protein YbjT (DUF2867 family)
LRQWALLEHLQKSGHDVVGVENDPLARQVASSRGLQIMEGSAESMPALRAASFDVVVMSHVLGRFAASGDATMPPRASKPRA